MAFLEDAVVVGAAATKTAGIAVNSAKVVHSALGRKSLTRMSKDSVFQFPMFLSADISVDDASVLTKSTERNYASLMVSIISLNNAIDRSKYDTVAAYLKKFHSNTDTPDIISRAVLFESAGTGIANPVTESVILDKNFTLSLWDNPEYFADMESLNDVYQPYKRTKKILSGCLEAMQSATTMEATSTSPFFEANRKNGTSYSKVDHIKAAIDGNRLVQKVDDTLKDIKNAESNDARAFTTVKKDFVRDMKVSSNIMQDRELLSMAPTMVSVGLVSYDTTKGSSAIWTQNVILGIKGMVRQIKSSVLIANVIEMCKGSNAAFKFIAATSGEHGWAKLFIDFFTGISTWKDLATGNANNRWVKMLRKRAKLSNYYKFIPGGKQLLPNATVIITAGEVLQIKDACGVDLTDVSHVKRIIDKYFLLSFGIYDTESKVLDVFYDGDEDFSSVSIRQLLGLVRKDTNLLIG